MLLIQNFISLGTLIDWIRRERERIDNFSNQWKYFTLAFSMIGSFIAWKVGNGSPVRVGGDSIMGKGSKEKPCICVLFRCSEETNAHLFRSFTYSQQIWRDLEGHLGLTNLWNWKL